MMNNLRNVAATVVVALSLAPSASCVERDTSTQLTVAIAAETQVPKELDTIQVLVVDSRGSDVYRNEYPVTFSRFFPTTLAIVPRDDDSLDGPVTIEVRGFKGSTATGQVFRRAVVRFFKGRTLLVPMPLRMACFNFADCNANETCAGGRCVTASIDPSTLEDFVGERVFGGLPNAACFDEAACLAGGTTIAVTKDCTFELPPAAKASDGSSLANVSIRWAAADNRVIGLDGDDPVEGWTRIDAKLGKLSPGVCDSLLDPETDPKLRRVPDKALDARLSTACATKLRGRPHCPGADGHTGVGTELPP